MKAIYFGVALLFIAAATCVAAIANKWKPYGFAWNLMATCFATGYAFVLAGLFYRIVKGALK